MLCHPGTAGSWDEGHVVRVFKEDALVSYFVIPSRFAGGIVTVRFVLDLRVLLGAMGLRRGMKGKRVWGAGWGEASIQRA